jgi:hypothetical protein
MLGFITMRNNSISLVILMPNVRSSSPSETSKNKVMLFLKTEEKYCIIWNCHVEKSSRFILINMEFHKDKCRHGKQAFELGNSILTFKITRIEKKNVYISTRNVGKCSGFITITNQFYNFSHCNAKGSL